MRIRNWMAEHQALSVWFGVVVFLCLVPLPLWWFDSHGGGEYLGALVGFFALLSGALFNAHLERERDDRLYLRQVQIAVGAAKGELLKNSTIISQAIKRVRDEADNFDPYLVDVDYQLIGVEVYYRNVEAIYSGVHLAKLDPSEATILEMFYRLVPIAKDQIKTFLSHDIPAKDVKRQATLESLEKLQKYGRRALTFLILNEAKLNPEAVAIQFSRIAQVAEPPSPDGSTNTDE